MNKGQVSVEFVSLLSIALLASSVLLGLLNYRVAAADERHGYVKAEEIAQRTAYHVEYLSANPDSKVDISYSPRLDRNYTVKIQSNQVTAAFEDGNASYPVNYNGPSANFTTSQKTTLIYSDGGVKVE
ncbi:MAG: hypothetical protein ABEJ95_00775 [Candidatus Nanohalobium sp.]